MTRMRKGFSLIEIIVALLLVEVLAVTSLNIYPLLFSICVKQERQFVTVNLALSQIEDLRKIAETQFYVNPGVLAAGTDYSHTEHIILLDGTYTLTYTVTDNNWTENDPPVNVDYKTVTATATDTTTNYTVKLTGYVTP